VLLHGFGDTGDMWAPLAAALARDHTVVVPDLRGMGLSSHPPGGYDKRTQAADVRAVLTHLGLDRAVIVGTISAPWSPMPMPLDIPTRPRSWW
jgi:pimeloyl-ACP methyl ester carboxylesterase